MVAFAAQPAAIGSVATAESVWAEGRGHPGVLDPALEGSLVGTGFPFKIQHLIPECVEQLARALRAGAGVRRGGSASLDLCYLAEGRLDGFW